ncbi:hypothetical protein MARINON1_52470 [Marinobacter salarius]|nr:hypothetical protein MBHK15_110276 [Marinobacter salarius]VXC24669.1 hypothetical protein MARINON1_52470 [Marinobacter salarius]
MSAFVTRRTTRLLHVVENVAMAQFLPALRALKQKGHRYEMDCNVFAADLGRLNKRHGDRL